MPHALIPLPDVYESVTRRVAVAVTAQLARIMRLPGDIQVYLPGNTESVPMNGGSFGECHDTGVRYPAETYLNVRFTEEVDDDHTLTTPVATRQHLPLFDDPVRGIVIRPVYRYVTLAVSLEYNAPNVTVAQRWVDEMRSRISMGRAELHQDLEYHYAIPIPVEILLRHLHETLEASQAPLGVSFDEYYDRYRQAPTTVLDTLTGTSPTRAIVEHQHEVLGWFDFTTSPPTPEAQDQGNYKSTITYTLRYNRPTQMYCRYPMLVHNRPVGPTFSPQVPYSTYRRVDRKVSQLKGGLDAFLKTMVVNQIPYIQQPEVDDWVPDTPSPRTLTFFSGLLQIKATDRRTLFDLSDLGSYTFTPYVLEYFYHMGNRLFESNSVFEFRLYENNVQRKDVRFLFKPNGVTVTADRDLDLTRFYHVQIGVIRNWLTLRRDFIDDLRRYPSTLEALLGSLGVPLSPAPERTPGGSAESDTAFGKPLELVGQGHPRYQTPDSLPGEGALVGETGQWPWPWLSEEWGEIPWAGGAWESPYHTGTVKNADFQAAIHATASRSLEPMNQRRVGPLTVLYTHILTLKTNAR